MALSGWEDIAVPSCIQWEIENLDAASIAKASETINGPYSGHGVPFQAVRIAVCPGREASVNDAPLPGHPVNLTLALRERHVHRGKALDGQTVSQHILHLPLQLQGEGDTAVSQG